MREFIIEDHPDQQFSLILERRRVTMRLVYNQVTERWSFDLSIDDLPILHGRRIVTGTDLLKAFDLGIGVIFAAPVIDGAVPDRVQLTNGSVKIYQTTEDEIASAIVPVVEEPQTPNVRPIIWTPPVATYFGQPFLVGRLLDDIEEGFAIDFLNDEALIRSNADPLKNFVGTFDAALSAGKFEYSRASTAFRYLANGLLASVANDVLRRQHDPLTGIPLGVLIEPASTNLVINSTVISVGTGVTVDSNVALAPDGNVIAEWVKENTANSEHYAGDTVIPGTTVGQKYFWSTFVKKTDNPRPLHLRTATAKNASATFDATGDGAWLAGSGFLSRGFEKLSNDWFRVWMIVEIATAGNLVCRVQLLNNLLATVYLGDGISGLYVTGNDARLLDRHVQHFPTAGVAAGPALDDFKIPTAMIPWHDGTGEFLINGVPVVPNVVSNKIVFPTTIVDPIATVQYRLVA